MLLQPTCKQRLSVFAHMNAIVRQRSTSASAAAASTAEDTEVRDPDWESARPFQEIPGPKPLPLVGNLWRFVPKIGNYGHLNFYQQQLQLQKDFGNIVRVEKLLLRKNQVWIYDPDLCEKVFRNEGRWPIREGLDSTIYYRKYMRNDMFGDWGGGLISQGEEWYKARTRVNKPLMQPVSARRYMKPVNEISDEFINRMRYIKDEKDELPSDFLNELFKWALESIAVIAMDTRLGCLAPELAPDSEQQKLINAVHVMINGFYELDIQPSPWKYISTPTWRRVVKAYDYFYDVLERRISEEAARGSQQTDSEPSILQKFLNVDRQLTNLVVSDMLFAGIDTTANAAAILLFFLATNPEKQEILRKEVLKALPDSPKQPITEDIFNNMPYLRACLKESLRILPIAVGNIRTTPKDIVLGDYQIPKGTEIFMCNMIMSRDEKHYPQAREFRPERWLRGHPEAHKAHLFVTMPFGFGVRMCVGRRFAELEIQVLVAKIIRNFRLEYHYGKEFQFVNKALNTPSSPMNFRLIEIENKS